MTSTNQERTILGPLTTTFVPAPSCIQNIVDANVNPDGDAWRGQTCAVRGSSFAVQDGQNCWPPRSAGVPAPAAASPLLGWGFYSPGYICPAGMTTACLVTAGQATGWPVQFAMTAGETAAGCCPSGYTCLNEHAQTCFKKATSTTVQLSVCAESGTTTALGLPRTNGTQVISSVSLFAPLIQINWHASDLPAIVSATTTASQSAGTSGSDTFPTQVVNSGNGSPGMSPGLITGVSVITAIATVGLAVTAWLLYRKKKQPLDSEKFSTNKAYPDSFDTTPIPPPPPPKPIHELNAGPEPYNSPNTPHPPWQEKSPGVTVLPRNEAPNRNIEKSVFELE